MSAALARGAFPHWEAGQRTSGGLAVEKAQGLGKARPLFPNDSFPEPARRLGSGSTALVINRLAAEPRVALKDTQVTVGCLWSQTVELH